MSEEIDFEYWNNILEQENLGVISDSVQDSIVSNVKKRVNKKIEMVDFSLNLNQIISEIERIKNCNVVIDNDKASINFLDLDGTRICDMFPGIIKGNGFPDDYTENHFYMDVNEDYHRKGFGTIILKLYEKLAQFPNNNFYMSGTEYKKKPKPILLYLSNGYKLKSVIAPDGVERDLLDYQVEEIIKEFKNPNMLSSYTSENIYKLEKEY